MKKADLAYKIKELRTKKGFSQEHLANLTALSLRTVQRIENGETSPRGDTITRLAIVLEVTPNDLIEWVEQEDRNFMALLNLSALSFIAFPLLGIMIPLALWILKKDKLKGIDLIGRKLLNFQITWCLVVFSWFILFIAFVTFDLRLPSFGGLIREGYMGMSGTEIMMLFIPSILYPVNLIFIIFNTIQSYRTGKVFYQPAIRLMR